MTGLTEDECSTILQTYVSKSKRPDQATAVRLAKCLTEEEQEVAALCSHAYWVTSIRSPEKLTKEIQFATAVREAYRHLDGIPEFEDSVKNLKATVQFHRERKTLLYRTCMNENFVYDDSDDGKLAAQREMRIKKEMELHTMSVRGHDKEKNAVWVCMPRKAQGQDSQGFVDHCIYMMERASACTESLSMGESDAILVVIDARHSSAPSIKAIKGAIKVLQDHYPARLKNLVVLDLPYLLQGIYNCVKPFMDSDTKAKFIIVKGDRAKESALAPLIDKSQLPHNLVRNGKLGSIIDGKRFLYDVPFHHLYDHIPSSKVMQITFKVSTIAIGVLSHCGRTINLSPVLC